MGAVFNHLGFPDPMAGAHHPPHNSFPIRDKTSIGESQPAQDLRFQQTLNTGQMDC